MVAILERTEISILVSGGAEQGSFIIGLINLIVINFEKNAAINICPVVWFTMPAGFSAVAAATRLLLQVRLYGTSSPNEQLCRISVILSQL